MPRDVPEPGAPPTLEEWFATSGMASRRDALAAVAGVFGLSALGSVAFGNVPDTAADPESRFRAYTGSELTADAKRRGDAYYPFLNERSMSLGIYRLAAGSPDRQQPHDEDEVYVVLEGKAGFEIGDRRVPVERGGVLYVPAGASHRFVDITQDLVLLVLFSKAPADAPKPPSR